MKQLFLLIALASMAILSGCSSQGMSSSSSQTGQMNTGAGTPGTSGVNPSTGIGTIH